MPHKKNLIPALATLLAMLVTAPVCAADAQKLYTQGLAATCANCHGTQGKSIKDGALPSLAGMKSDYLIEQMQAFKTGTRSATIMHQISKGFSEEQTKQLADYFASQKP